MTIPALDTEPLDQALAELREGAVSWTTTPIAERIALLERLMPRIVARAADMAAVPPRAATSPRTRASTPSTSPAATAPTTPSCGAPTSRRASAAAPTGH
ncbi:hypothetical protein ACFVU4_27310 [Streptomyces sp. NPDC058107]|uniref:hypothetical protein n=1 Tax=Streptomyces sp. NPDC058107 TaxID=3346343 RepID=UPI0036EC9A58